MITTALTDRFNHLLCYNAVQSTLDIVFRYTQYNYSKLNYSISIYEVMNNDVIVV